ncbi:hypothetical protein RHGRI_034656 [Rhododendron griersonianum]|uniref:AB hydrolase-1 domain-containing protein n=1 Tax=Rhododendron griersonianum TaxID=479676 RepID=A0AAV6I7H4_9ERIC|nr:hypothetical protein RHGRI_034656 [Rhododendron griersonianum]
MVVLRSAIQIAAQTFCWFTLVRSDSSSRPLTPASLRTPTRSAASAAATTTPDKPSICTADELHYVSVPNSDWRLALWRYKPPPKAPPRNHPLFLLSGVATNAIGFDLSPGELCSAANLRSSFARYMSSQGFDTWILEVRGAGLSTGGVRSAEVKKPGNDAYSVDQTPDADSSNMDVIPARGRGTEMVTKSDKSRIVTKLTETIVDWSEKLSGWLNEGSSEAGQNSASAKQIRDLSQRLINIIEEGQQSIPPQFIEMQDRIVATIEDLQIQLDVIVKYDWDFDHYLEEDVPVAVRKVHSTQQFMIIWVLIMVNADGVCKEPMQAKGWQVTCNWSLNGGYLAICNAISKRTISCPERVTLEEDSDNSFEGKDSGLASVITLASSLDYSTSRSSLKRLLPLESEADPAQALSVPAIPLGVLLTAAYPLAARPPYVLSGLKSLASAQNMHPELFEKLILNNFCTVPAKLLLQLSTAFQDGGLCDRSRSFFYKDHLHKGNVPVLAIAGDRDLICPPEAVFETVKLLPKNMVSYKVFGEPSGPHYAHYDLVGGPEAADQVYPFILEFLSHHDMA